MDSKRTSRRELLKSGAALAGGLTVGDMHRVRPKHTTIRRPRAPKTFSDDPRQQGVDRIRPALQVRDLGAHTAPPGGRPSPDLFGKQFHIATPLQDSVGTITPSSLHYVATTRGSYMPDIDPRQHTLTIHGLVDNPLTLTMDDLRRFPSVTRMHFIECAGNRHNGRQKTCRKRTG